MTETNSVLRQPTSRELDFASPTQFRFSIQKLPEVQFFTQTINIPGVSVDGIIQPTALSQISLAGSDLSYEDLSVSFLIDEEYRNYREVFDWLKSILIDFSEKEVNSICNNFIDDKIALDYLKKQHKTNKETFEINLLKNMNNTKLLSNQNQDDNIKILRPPKL